MNCNHEVMGICLTKAQDAGPSIFGFPDFLTALALLALAFSSSDALYRFKIEIAPIPLRLIAFLASVIIGGGSLMTDFWFATGWYSLPWGWSRAGIQAGLGALFLLVIMLWLWFAFVARTSFNRFNYKRFHGAVYRGMVRGSIVELTVIAEQLPAAAESLIRHTAPPFTGAERDEKSTVAPLQRYAHDVLWLLGNRKFCRVLMASSPHTAIVIMTEASRQKRYDLPLATFVQNLTLEGVLNNDSQIYHEDRNSMTSIFGYIQPFTSAVYGNYELLEKIGGGMMSSLDLDWQSYRQFSAAQWEAYLRITLVAIEGYAGSGRVQMRSQLLTRAIDQIKTASSETYQLNGTTGAIYRSDLLAKLSASISFIRDALTALDKAEGVAGVQARFSEPTYYGQGTILDDLADLLYHIILDASGVEGPPDLAWTVYYNTVWSPIFNYGGQGAARSLVLFKLRRRLFDEIKRLEEFPNFEGARILAFTLNVIGFRYDPTSTIDRPWLPLGKATTGWTRRNYLSLRRANLRVAEACLIGRVTFDEANSKIVKTYVQGLHAEPPRALLDLDPPTD
jgi:hypothetical protein